MSVTPASSFYSRSFEDTTDGDDYASENLNSVRFEVKWVRAQVANACTIWHSIDKDTQAIFGKKNVKELQEIIESALYAVVTASNEFNETLNFACIDSAPQFSLLREFWQPWLSKLFGLTTSTYENTCFITYLYLEDESPLHVLKILLQNIVLDNVKIHNIILVIPANSNCPKSLQVLELMGEEVIPVEFISELKHNYSFSSSTTKLHVFTRDEIMKEFRVRKAIPEDNDDIIDILDESSPELRRTFGDFFIARIILFNYEQQQIIVLDRQNIAVALLCFNIQVHHDFVRMFSDYNTVISRVGGSFQNLSEDRVFIIELFDINHEIDERLSDLLVEAIFEVYPSKDYCLIGMPTHFHHFHLLNRFIKIDTDNASQELYVVSRSSINSSLSVVSAADENIDPNAIIYFITVFVNNYTVITATRNLFQKHVGKNEANRDQVYIFLAENTIAGICLIEPALDINSMCVNFDLEQFVSFDTFPKPEQHGCIKHLFLCYEFLNQMKFFLREISRLSGFIYFYFKIYKPEDYLHVNPISDLIPIRPRRRIFYDTTKLKKFNINPDLTDEEQPYALYHFNTKLIPSFYKKHVNARIVILGASTTAFSFFETLFFSELGQNYWFTNITLIESSDLSDYQDDSLDNVEELFEVPQYTRKQLTKLCFQTWVNVIQGTLTKIDCKNKYVLIDSARKLQYDYLYIFAGLQYNVPLVVKNQDIVPKNMFLLNNLMDAKIMLKYMKKKVPEILENQSSSEAHKIIIYGSALSMYSLINYFIALGVPGKSIVLILTQEHFTDKYVIKIIEKKLTNENITILKYYKLINWTLNTKISTIEQVQFGSSDDETTVININCLILVSFGKKRVNKHLYNALKQAYIVFNGRLIIDPYYQTSDIYIRAAGPITKYRAVLYADNNQHDMSSSKEVGADVANKMLMRIANKQKLEQVFNAHYLDNSLLTCKYVEPIVENAILPNALYYLNVRPPGPATSGKSMSFITGQNLVIEIQYFRLSFDGRYLVNGFTCLSPEKFNVSNLVQLYGKPNSLLGDAIDRYNHFKIIDFFDYFDQPWIYCIYHDKFNKYILKSQQDHRQSTKKKLLNFIKTYHLELPTYVNPDLMKDYLDELTPQNEQPTETGDEHENFSQANSEVTDSAMYKELCPDLDSKSANSDMVTTDEDDVNRFCGLTP